MSEENKNINIRACRICLQANFSNGVTVDSDGVLFQMYKFCFGVTMTSEDNPRKLCRVCLNKLKKFSEFKKNALRSEKLWKSMISISIECSKIKSEKDEIDYKTDDELVDNSTFYHYDNSMNDSTMLKEADRSPSIMSIDYEILSNMKFDNEDNKDKDLMAKLKCPKEEIEPNDTKMYSYESSCIYPFDATINKKKRGKYKINKNKAKSQDTENFVTNQATTKRHYKKRVYQITNKGKPYSPTHDCGLCDKIFTESKKLQQHLNEHSTQNDLCCKLCGFTGRDFADMVTHRYDHFSKKYKVDPQCHLCNKKIRNLLKLQFHYRTVHLNDKGGLCSVCNKQYKDYIAWRNHEKFHVIQRFICDICGRRFLFRHSIIEHLANHSEYKGYVCDICGRQFKRESNLRLVMTEKQEALLKAIEAVNKGASISAASRQYGIPRTTLDDKIRGRYAVGCSKGPATILSKEEEEHLKNWIIFMADRGFPVSKAQLLDSVSLLMKKMKRSNSFHNDRPGRHWFEAFLKRNPQVGQRVAQNLTQSRALVQEINVRQWFKEIEDYFVMAQLEVAAQDPRRIFNCDESAFFLSPADNRVLAKRGAKNIYNVIPSGERECVTVLITANAAGELAPPMVLFKLKSIPHKISKTAPIDWGLGFTQKGWMTGESFYEYMANVFYPWLEKSNIQRPIIFYLDGHCSHTTLPLSNFCREKSIQLIALYPNATHLLQPMDVAVFRPLKRIWKKTVYDWRNNNNFLKLKKEHFCPLLHKTLTQLDPNSIQNGFRKCGLSPFDANSVDYSKCVLSNRINTAEPGNINQKETDSVGHFKYFESQISSESLKSFYDNTTTTWKGDKSLKGLFEVWRQMKLQNSSDDFNNGSSSLPQMSRQDDTCEINDFDISVGNFTGLTDMLDSKLLNSNEFSGFITECENHTKNAGKLELYDNLNGTLMKIMEVEVSAKEPVPTNTFSFENETHDIPNLLGQDLQKVDMAPVYVDICNNFSINTVKTSEKSVFNEETTPSPVKIQTNEPLLINLVEKDRLKYSGQVIRTVGSDPIYFTSCKNMRSSTGLTSSICHSNTETTQSLGKPDITLQPSTPVCSDFTVELMQTETQSLPITGPTLFSSKEPVYITPPGNKSQILKKIKTTSPIAGTSSNYVQSETTPPHESKPEEPLNNNDEQPKTRYYGDLVVPTPFKNALFWPETPSCSTKSKVKLPSVITSDRWQIFSQKKEEAKKQKENNKIKIKDRKLKNNKPGSGNNKSKKKLIDTEAIDITNENWYCRLCQRSEKLDMIQCVTCKTWYHTICAEILPDQITFHCSYCNSMDE